MKCEFTEKQIREKASEDLQDAIHNDGCLEAFANSDRSLRAWSDLVARLHYLESKNTYAHAEDRLIREQEDAFERGEAS